MLRQTVKLLCFRTRFLYSNNAPVFKTIVQQPKYHLSVKLPKHKKLDMPALSPTMEKGNIMKWHKKEGDQVIAGDCICEVETDKATVGFEVQEEGYIAKIIKPEGSQGVKVGDLVAIIVSKKIDLTAFANYQSGVAEEPEPVKESPIPAPTKAAPAAKKDAGAPVSKYPKHSKLGLPALSPTMEKGNLMSWSKKEGDKLNAGDVICEIETDKASVGFEIQEDGYLAKILVPAGTKDIQLGTVLAVTTQKKENVKEFANYSLTDSPVAATQQQSQPVHEEVKTSAAPRQTGERIFASPLAKGIAQEHNVNLANIQGSGVEGSIIKKDVENHLASTDKVASVEAPKKEAVPQSSAQSVAAPAAAKKQAAQVVQGNQYEDIPLSNMRQVIAARLLESKTTIPHYYLTVNITMDKLLKLREDLNKVSKTKLSVNDFIVKASALALKDIPAVNSQWNGTFIRKFHNADISIAVSTDAGLITPIVFNAGAKGLSEIAQNVKDLAEKARTNKLKPQEFQGGTFTISNLGMFGIDQFVAVINPPQAAILAVGKSTKVLVPGEGDHKVEQHMSVTLSCDHRVVDGAVGAQWLQRFKIYMEEPQTMLL